MAFFFMLFFKRFIMKYGWFVFSIALFFSCKSEHFKYPETKKANTVDVYFGKEVADPYRWLEDPSSPDVKSWIEAQNEVTMGYLSRIPFRDTLKARLTEVWNYERYGNISKEGGKYYFLKNNGLQNQDVLYAMDSIGSEPYVVLDPNLFHRTERLR